MSIVWHAYIPAIMTCQTENLFLNSTEVPIYGIFILKIISKYLPVG